MKQQSLTDETLNQIREIFEGAVKSGRSLPDWIDGIRRDYITVMLLDEVGRLRAELKNATRPTVAATITLVPADYRQCCPVCNKEINYDSFHHHDLQKQELHWECQHCKVKWISK